MADLDRFVRAQSGTYETALGELRHGAKRSHWIWFIFPQIAGLGRSETAQYYAIAGTEEASGYLAHPVLGPRLIDCCAALMTWAGRREIEAMLGPIDAVKLKSSMTLFEAVAGKPEPFSAILRSFFAAKRDNATLAILAGG